MSLYGEQPNHDPELLKDYRDFSDRVLTSLFDWTLHACYQWKTTHPDFAFTSAEVRALLVGEEGIFPGGTLCRAYLEPDFHPGNTAVDAWITAWDAQWDAALQARCRFEAGDA